MTRAPDIVFELAGGERLEVYDEALAAALRARIAASEEARDEALSALCDLLAYPTDDAVRSRAAAVIRRSGGRRNPGI